MQLSSMQCCRGVDHLPLARNKDLMTNTHHYELTRESQRLGFEWRDIINVSSQLWADIRRFPNSLAEYWPYNWDCETEKRLLWAEYLWLKRQLEAVEEQERLLCELYICLKRKWDEEDAGKSQGAEV